MSFLEIRQEPSVYDTELRISDVDLAAIVIDTDVSNELYWRDPVLWVRAAIGFDFGRGASEIGDHELAEAYTAGGFAEWDPRMSQAVRDYLVSQGYVGLYGSIRD